MAPLLSPEAKRNPEAKLSPVAAHSSVPKSSRPHTLPRPLAKRVTNPPTRGVIVVLALSLLVHCLIADTASLAQTKRPEASRIAPASGSAAAKATKLNMSRDLSSLPANVTEMRDHILSAVISGKIEDLKLAIEWNEITPNFGDKAGDDAIAYFKGVSSDGEGREILAIIANLLDAPYASVPLGPDIENNLIYVWPYFAEVPLKQLSPAQQVGLMRLVPAADFKAMMATGKYTGYRLSIAADGTWHEFHKGE